MIEFLAILAVFIFRFGYWICGVFYPSASIEWWDLRFTLFTSTFGICLYIARYGSRLSIFTKKVLTIGFVYFGGDIIDRYLCNIQTYHFNDILLDVFALFTLASYFITHYEQSKRIKY